MYELIGKSINKFLPYLPYPKAKDRDSWNDLDSTLKNKVIEEGKSYLEYDFPRLTAAMFMRFAQDGERTAYKKIYSARRIALDALVLAECIEFKGRFMKDIINGIFTICEESGWQDPSHNTYIRDERGPILPDADKPVLALFSCETGAMMATIDYLLGDSLDEISPIIRKRIKSEVNRRIIEPYLNRHFWWMGRDQEPMNNWTAWCTQNILITFFISECSEDKRMLAFQKACKSLDHFLKEYEDDGCCDEGAQYYRKAALCLMNATEVLNSVSNNQFDGIYNNSKIYNMVNYILDVHVGGKYYINFSDCAAVAGASGIREFIFGYKTNNKKLMNHAALDYKYLDLTNTDEEFNLFYRLQELFNYSDIMDYKEKTIDEKSTYESKDVFLDSTGLSIVRDKSLCLAVKAGDNGDSHNHNDTGSFILYKNENPVIVDIGVETYRAKTFSPDRYDIWTMQSDYHNLPTINGFMQKDGEEHKAVDVIRTNNKKVFYLNMDISKAYPKEANIKYLTRSIVFNKNKDIRIDDNIEFNEDRYIESIKNTEIGTHSEIKVNTDKVMGGDSKSKIECISNFILYNQPIIRNKKVSIGSKMEIQFSGEIKSIIAEELVISDTRLRRSWNKNLYRLRVTYLGNQLKTVINHKN